MPRSRQSSPVSIEIDHDILSLAIDLQRLREAEPESFEKGGIVSIRFQPGTGNVSGIIDGRTYTVHPVECPDGSVPPEIEGPVIATVQ